MHHLTNLRWLNVGWGLFLGAIVVLFVAMFAGAGLLAVRDGEQMGWIFVAAGAGAGAILGALAALHLWVAVRIGGARGRVAQTVLALVHVANFPLGTAFAAYALWVCWSEPACKAAFDRNQGG